MEDEILFSFLAHFDGKDHLIRAELIHTFIKRIDFRIETKMVAQAKLRYYGWTLEFFFYDFPTIDDRDVLLDRINDYFKENPRDL